MQDLLKEYKKTRKMLQAQYDQLRDEHTPKGYRVPLKNGKIKRIYDGLDCRRQLIGEMISDVEYVIEWLETGRRPGNRRGIERQAAYQRERLMDPVRMQAFAARSTAGSPANITEWEHQQIEDALCELSERERECFELAYGQCFSHAYIAEMLNISVSSVETYIKRANAKVSERVKTSLFLAV